MKRVQVICAILYVKPLVGIYVFLVIAICPLAYASMCVCGCVLLYNV